MSNIKTTEEKYEELITKLEVNRNGLYPVLEKMESFRKNLDIFMPKDTSDFRNRNILKESMKSLTEIIKAEVDIRKTIENSIKTEIELRNKLKDDDKEIDDDLDIDNYDDIKKMSENL